MTAKKPNDFDPLQSPYAVPTKSQVAPPLSPFLSWDSLEFAPPSYRRPASTPSKPKPAFDASLPSDACVPLSWFDHLSGLLRQSRSGVLQPDPTMGFPAFPAQPTWLKSQPSYAFPATRTPFEEFPSSTADIHHCSHCLPVVSIPRNAARLPWPDRVASTESVPSSRCEAKKIRNPRASNDGNRNCRRGETTKPHRSATQPQPRCPNESRLCAEARATPTSCKHGRDSADERCATNTEPKLDATERAQTDRGHSTHEPPKSPLPVTPYPEEADRNHPPASTNRSQSLQPIGAKAPIRPASKRVPGGRNHPVVRTEIQTTQDLHIHLTTYAMRLPLQLLASHQLLRYEYPGLLPNRALRKSQLQGFTPLTSP
jgi:hypothetical protein